MKRIFTILFLTATLAAVFSSCKDDDDDKGAQAWMLANQQAINAIKSNPEYTELPSPGNEGSIYYKVITKGTGAKIYYTSTVSCYYKGWFAADHTYYSIKNGDVFQKLLYGDGPAFTAVVGTDVISGWKTALENMVEGDKWEIWVPYQLGYGSSDRTDSNGYVSIPGYATLVFEIEVVKVVQ
ncbi:MAG: FKBP-type peptidyl-prolyl cis-trans isomerase [Tannerella sp.]|jgi:peptidylprolyl isomerase/FKBP-type peptidyl-prolyl cis-trans isomerase FklB|nr:FKBP-type peptidyl-prolyl cis-trans isomerase [Tannerella sp.]